MKKAIRDHLRDFLAIAALILIAAGVSVYILGEQRFRFPLLEDKPFKLRAELENAQAVTPGQGQTVEVAGVKIGLIGKVGLRDGRAIVDLEIEPRFKDVVREDATALLRPRTGLKDMFIQVDPGSESAPPAREGFTIPVARTMTDVDLDEILSALDADTRSYIQLLVDGAGKGLKERGGDLAELFERFGPTARDLRRVNQAVALERDALKDAIHGLSRLTEELAGRDEDLADLVASSAAVFKAFASEDRNVSATVRGLPAALSQTTQTMADVERFARELRPAAERLVPVFGALDDANEAVRPIARQVTPPLRDQIRPFVRESRPVVQDLTPAAEGLGAAMPDLTSSFGIVNKLFNMLSYNPGGKEPPDKAGREEGFLFWLAWVTHQSANLVNIDDANGPLRPVFLTGTCQTLVTLIDNNPQLEFLMGLSALLADQCDSPDTLSQRPERFGERLKKELRMKDRVAQKFEEAAR
jgi:phospholipid/cholesterol/gamma-HCH transport system substrate-binding protein